MMGSFDLAVVAMKQLTKQLTILIICIIINIANILV